MRRVDAAPRRVRPIPTPDVDDTTQISETVLQTSRFRERTTVQLLDHRCIQRIILAASLLNCRCRVKGSRAYGQDESAPRRAASRGDLRVSLECHGNPRPQRHGHVHRRAGACRPVPRRGTLATSQLTLSLLMERQLGAEGITAGENAGWRQLDLPARCLTKTVTEPGSLPHSDCYRTGDNGRRPWRGHSVARRDAN